MKPEPLIVTTVPTGPDVGEKLSIIGCISDGVVGAVTVNACGVKATCDAVNKPIEPVEAPEGIVTCACESLTTRTAAVCAPPANARVTPANPEPLMVTTLPTAPRLNVSGLKDEAVAAPPDRVAAIQAAVMNAVQQVMARTEDVGERFPEEARRIHYGEAEARGIRGRASAEDAEALPTMRATVEALGNWHKPALVMFSDKDPITAGGEKFFRKLIPSAASEPEITIHNAGHFLQEDKGEEIAEHIADFIQRRPIPE